MPDTSVRGGALRYLDRWGDVECHAGGGGGVVSSSKYAAVQANGPLAEVVGKHLVLFFPVSLQIPIPLRFPCPYRSRRRTWRRGKAGSRRAAYPPGGARRRFAAGSDCSLQHLHLWGRGEGEREGKERSPGGIGGKDTRLSVLSGVGASQNPRQAEIERPDMLGTM